MAFPAIAFLFVVVVVIVVAVAFTVFFKQRKLESIEAEIPDIPDNAPILKENYLAHKFGNGHEVGIIIKEETAIYDRRILTVIPKDVDSNGDPPKPYKMIVDRGKYIRMPKKAGGRTLVRVYPNSPFELKQYYARSEENILELMQKSIVDINTQNKIHEYIESGEKAVLHYINKDKREFSQEEVKKLIETARVSGRILNAVEGTDTKQ